MITLGMNFSSEHDSAAAIAVDGEIKFAIAEERLERVDIHRVQICALTIDSMDMNALGVCS